MILISKYIVPKGYSGITLYPFVILRSTQLSENKELINHEKIHLKQQLELLIIPFFIWYSIEFLIRLIWLQHWNSAYRSISFEKEAYANEGHLAYLKTRKTWNFLKYIRTDD
jgi:hypothetical protein